MERRGRLLPVPLLMLAGFCVLAGRSACCCKKTTRTRTLRSLSSFLRSWIPCSGRRWRCKRNVACLPVRECSGALALVPTSVRSCVHE